MLLGVCGLSAGWGLSLNAQPIRNCEFCPGQATPPPGEVRAMAEWEEVGWLLVALHDFEEAQREIICAAAQTTQVLVLSSDPVEDSLFLAQRCPGIQRVRFLTTPAINFNTAWTRDYGPQSVYLNDVDSLLLVDWKYNRPTRPLDNCLPGHLGHLLGYPVFVASDSTSEPPNDLVNPGGNFLPDGRGRGFASSLLLEENGLSAPEELCVKAKTPEEIEALLQRYAGIEELVVLPRLEYDVIHHLDLTFKLLDERTILLGRFPPDSSDYALLEQIAESLEGRSTSGGHRYRLLRMPMPPCENGNYPPNCDSPTEYPTYVNAHIVNERVLVPVYGIPLDSVALALWAEALPGYDLIPIPSREISKARGAVHCVTREIGVPAPLLIQHERLDTLCADEPQVLRARIRHRRGIQQGVLWYAIGGGAFQSLPLEETEPGWFEAALPALPAGTQVRYYFEATTEDGTSRTRPLPGAPAAWTAAVAECLSATDSPSSVQGLRLFPNPAAREIHLELALERPALLQARILTPLGHSPSPTRTLYLLAGRQHLRWDLEALPAGPYFLELVIECRVFRRMFLKF